MNLEVIRRIAKSHNLHPGKRSKAELIRAIQSEEGNFSCFGSASDGECDQTACSWREDCFETGRGEPR